jgi:hypothetical protein
MTSAAEVKAWERQDGEPDAAYDAFKGYVFQAPPRRLIHTSVKLRTSEVSALFNEWRWAERALAYDRHVASIALEEREALLREDERDRTAAHLRMLKGVQQVINREIAKLVRDTEKSEAFGTVKVSDLNKLLNTAITLERLVHGESTANVAAVDASLERLTLDELRELQRLQAKLSGDEDDEAAKH